MLLDPGFAFSASVTAPASGCKKILLDKPHPSRYHKHASDRYLPTAVFVLHHPVTDGIYGNSLDNSLHSDLLNLSYWLYIVLILCYHFFYLLVLGFLFLLYTYI